MKFVDKYEFADDFSEAHLALCGTKKKEGFFDLRQTFYFLFTFSS